MRLSELEAKAKLLPFAARYKKIRDPSAAHAFRRNCLEMNDTAASRLA